MIEINKQSKIYVNYIRELVVKHSSIDPNKSTNKNYKMFKLMYKSTNLNIFIGNMMIENNCDLKEVIKQWKNNKCIISCDFNLDIIKNGSKKIIKINNDKSMFEFNYEVYANDFINIFEYMDDVIDGFD